MKIIRFILLVIIIIIFHSCSNGSLESNRSLQRFLKSHNFHYKIDHDGDYMVNSDNDFKGNVWIRGKINYTGSTGIREIFAFSSTIGESEIIQVSKVLLMDNIQTRVMGSWSILLDPDRGKYLVLYIVKAPLNANDEYIYQAMKEASEAVMVLEKVLFPES